MGRSFISKGYVIPTNIQAGRSIINTNENGDGIKEVFFKKGFKSTPIITLTVEGADLTGTITLRSRNTNKFTMGIDGSSLTSENVVVNWVAIDVTIPK